MKKILSIIAIVAMIATLFASCGGGEGSVSSIASQSTTKPSTTIDGTKIEYEEIGDPSVRKNEPELGADLSKAIRVTSFSLGTDSVSLHIGKKGTLTYTVSPANATDSSVYWFSANEDIVKIDKDGNFLGVGKGCTTISGETTDGRFKRSCTVVVTENEGNNEKAAEMIALINNLRKENNLSELKNDNIKLNGMSNQRVYEEGIEFVASGFKTKPDNKRPDGTDHSTVYKQYDLSWARNLASMGTVYDKGMTAQKAFDTMIKTDSVKQAALAKDYNSVAVGYYERDGYAFWTVWFVTF